MDKTAKKCDNIYSNLRGGVEFPTGGDGEEPKPASRESG